MTKERFLGEDRYAEIATFWSRKSGPVAYTCNDLGFHLLSAVLAGTATSGALAVVGFLDFATRFGHGGLLSIGGFRFAESQIIAGEIDEVKSVSPRLRVAANPEEPCCR